jgi:putative membrane protein
VARQVAAAAGAVTLAAMIATPLLPARGAGRRRLSSVVVGGLWTTTTAVAARRWGTRRAGAAAGLVGVATAAVEHAGTRTGLPFGRYAYTGALRPQVLGVPAIVPLAWWAMAVPARDTAHAALGTHSRTASRIAAGSVALTAWDLFLDPQMVGEGYWAWAKGGRYRGIPLSNFAGWFATGIGVMAALEALLPMKDGDSADPALVAEYSMMAVMETVGFAAYFRDRLVAAVGGAAMLPPALLAVRRMARG